MTNVALAYDPQPKQRLLHETPAHQVFYGGAAGGGKSHSMRWDAIGFCLQYPGLEAYLFRRTYPELEANHIRQIRAELPRELGKYSETRRRYEFYNGSAITFCYCEDEKDVTRYQGHEIHWLGVDEAAHLTAFQLNYLRTRVRLGQWMPTGYDGPTNAVFRLHLPRIVLSSNPGGPGHDFLKSTFILPAPPMEIFMDESMAHGSDAPWPTIFIPAGMNDNQYIGAGYAGQFSSLPEEMRRALVEGDWDAVVGAALHTLSKDRHQIRPFTPPGHWTKFMAMDWGTAKPFSVGWYTVSEGALLAEKDGWPEVWLPEGALIRYREYYGWNGKADQGCRIPSHHVAAHVLSTEDERNEVMDYRIGDSQMWASTDGPSPQERMAHFTDGRFAMRKSKKDRKIGYEEILARLAGNPRFIQDGVSEDWPMLFATVNCRHFWRTLPTLTLDETDPEKGPNTKLEDHIYDELVYACRSRPFVTTEQDRWEEEMAMFVGRSRDPYAT